MAALAKCDFSLHGKPLGTVTALITVDPSPLMTEETRKELQDHLRRECEMVISIFLLSREMPGDGVSAKETVDITGLE